MAKATAYCTCKECGSEFVKTKMNCKNRKDADSWENWAKGYYDICPKCWLEEQRRLEHERGLIAEPRIGNPYTYSQKEIPRIALVLYGDTFSIKDRIKNIGGIYTDDYPSRNSQFAGGLLGNLFDNNPKRWVVWSDIDEYEAITQKLCNIGFIIEDIDKDTFAMWVKNITILKQMREEEQVKAKQEKEQQKQIDQIIQERIIAEIGNIPDWPQLVKDKCPDGAKWNGTVYGGKGNKSIYLNGNKVRLDDEEAELMESTAKARDDWRKNKKGLEEKIKTDIMNQISISETE